MDPLAPPATPGPTIAELPDDAVVGKVEVPSSSPTPVVTAAAAPSAITTARLSLQQAVVSLKLAGHDATAVEAQLAALPAPPPAAPSPLSELSVLAADRKLGKAITSLTKAKDEVVSCRVALEAASTALSAAELVVHQREEAVAAARVALKEASERRHEIPSSPPPASTPGTDASGLRSTVCSLRQLVTGIEASVPTMGPKLAASWEAYAASEVEPKLPQTDWLLREVTTSLTPGSPSNSL